MSYYLQKYTNHESRFLVIEGSLIHYRDEGAGQPILMLHGAFSSLHTFESWKDILIKKGFRVLRIDLPGFGLTGSRHDHDYSIPMYCHVIESFLKLLNVEQCHIAGNSLGGWLAWELALHNPKLVDRLVLISSAGFLDDRSIPLPFKMAKTPFVNRVIKYAVKRNMLEQFVREVYGDKSKITTELIDRYYDLFSREGNPEAFLSLCNQKMKDNTHKLKHIKHDTLILWGENDEWLPVENAYRFSIQMPNSKLIIYEGVGHIAMEEIPVISSKDVSGFLGKSNKASRSAKMYVQKTGS